MSQKTKKSMTANDRSNIVDILRALAIILMIIFHFTYDMKMFGLNKIDFQNNLFWWFLPRLIVFLFLFTMGISTTYVHLAKIDWPSWGKRMGKVGGGAIFISLSTYFLFPDRWIYFGTLHCIALSSLAILPFLKWPKVSFFLSIIIIVPKLFFNVGLNWFTMKHHSMDYIPFYPWFGVCLLGVFAYHHNFHRLNLRLAEKILSKLRFMSKNSFFIYMLHQPILYGIVYLIWQCTKV